MKTDYFAAQPLLWMSKWLIAQSKFRWRRGYEHTNSFASQFLKVNWRQRGVHCFAATHYGQGIAGALNRTSQLKRESLWTCTIRVESND